MVYKFDVHGYCMYYPVMNKSYFSASDLFAALESKAKQVRARITLAAISSGTGISPYRLRKLKIGTAEHLSSQDVDQLFAYSQSVGLKISHEKIVKVVVR